MAEYKNIVVEKRLGALWITLNRAEELNSLNLALVEEFSAAIDSVERDPSLKLIVITGAGRAFSAGGDLKEMDDGSGGYRGGAFLFGAISKLLMRLEGLPHPVVAAVNGIAVAGGLELALACDIVVAAQSAVFGDGHVRYGLLPGGGGSVRLPRKIGINRAKYMMLTGKTFSARVLQDWGLVNEIAEDGKLIELVDGIAAELTSKSPLAMGRIKHLIDEGFEQPISAALAAEQSLCALHDDSFDRNEGLSAFATKRQPVFRGS